MPYCSPQVWGERTWPTIDSTWIPRRMPRSLIAARSSVRRALNLPERSRARAGETLARATIRGQPMVTSILDPSGILIPPRWSRPIGAPSRTRMSASARPRPDALAVAPSRSGRARVMMLRVGPEATRVAAAAMAPNEGRAPGAKDASAVPTRPAHRLTARRQAVDRRWPPRRPGPAQGPAAWHREPPAPATWRRRRPSVPRLMPAEHRRRAVGPTALPPSRPVHRRMGPAGRLTALPGRRRLDVPATAR